MLGGTYALQRVTVVQHFATFYCNLQCLLTPRLQNTLESSYGTFATGWEARHHPLEFTIPVLVEPL